MSVAEGKGSATNLPIVLDGRWLNRADPKAEFELRNVRIQDVDYFVTLAEAKRIPLNISAIPENAQSFSGEITDEMRMGKRPELPVRNESGWRAVDACSRILFGWKHFPDFAIYGRDRF